jgi:hypothetical protein
MAGESGVASRFAGSATALQNLCAFALKIKMSWIVQNLWLIPAPPILAAGLSALAPQENVARKGGCEYISAI